MASTTRTRKQGPLRRFLRQVERQRDRLLGRNEPSAAPEAVPAPQVVHLAELAVDGCFSDNESSGDETDADASSVDDSCCMSIMSTITSELPDSVIAPGHATKQRCCAASPPAVPDRRVFRWGSPFVVEDCCASPRRVVNTPPPAIEGTIIIKSQPAPSSPEPGPAQDAAAENDTGSSLGEDDSSLNDWLDVDECKSQGACSKPDSPASWVVV